MGCRGLVGLLVDVVCLQSYVVGDSHIFAGEGWRTWCFSAFREDRV